MIKQLCALYLKWKGWKFVNNVPDEIQSFVFIGAPHTSNYDILPTLALSLLMRRNTKFVIKGQWLKFPFGPILKYLGAIGLDREKIKAKGKANTTELMAGFFKECENLVLIIAPEGTRGPNPNWKTGFYYIAQKANVPIVLGYADYAKKEAGLGKIIYPKNFNEDMKAINNFYRPLKGKHPENFRLNIDYTQEQAI